MRIRIEEALRYDPELGEVQTLVEGVVREAMRVRVALVDDYVRRALIVELERLGYTVTPPPDTD